MNNSEPKQIDGVCCQYCIKFEQPSCPVKTASPWSRWGNWCNAYHPNPNMPEARPLPDAKPTSHLPDCDINDHNPDGIRKPCNCGSGFNPDCPATEHHEKPTTCPDCNDKQATINRLRKALFSITEESVVAAIEVLRETKPCQP
jgi:hypothetical protein